MKKRIGKVEKDLDGFKKIVAQSRSVKEVIDRMGYKESGGVYKHLRLKFDEYQIDSSHFTGQGWAKGKSSDTDDGVKRQAERHALPWEEVFCKNSKYRGGGKSLIKKLICAKKKEYKCEECEIVEWKGRVIRLELDHKNGDNRDNREENLRILCPNCHSQTETHSRRLDVR
jgi:Zn finger protein HypA/HybF involved in hydrogenase expression